MYLYLAKDSIRLWAPPVRATLPVVTFFFLSNLFLVIAPLVPPESGPSVYDNLPYWVSLHHLRSTRIDIWPLAAARRRLPRSVRPRSALLVGVDYPATEVR